MYMANNIFSSRLHDSVENYYNYKPDTLMPLLMVALTTQGKLSISDQENGIVFCSINLNEVMNYDWVKLDPALRKQFNLYLSEGKSTIKVTGILDESLKDIYHTFYHYDTYTVEQEYHHRIGILYHHSSNEASEHAHREYATYCLATALLDSPIEILQDRFLNIANYVLVKSGLQPERPRLRVAETLCTLLNYEGEGIVYNPFAGCAIAAAMIQAGDMLYADGDTNDKLYAAARLLNYGMGGNNAHVQQRNSLEWLNGSKIDYVISTYRGYINGKSAFDFCLSKCFETLADGGKFAGIVSPKDIFEHQSDEMKEALKRDWIETIVLLPFGEVAVLVNANKSSEMKKQVRFYNLNHPMLRHRPIKRVLSDESNADFFKVSDIKKKDFLKNFINPELPERDGYIKVRLRDIVKKIPRKVYNIGRVRSEDRVLASINRSETYYGNRWNENIRRNPIYTIFEPVYKLKEDSLIVNSVGMAEPRLFDADCGSAFFKDGLAFNLNSFNNPWWLAEELKETYVRKQLYPYGLSEMAPEKLTEDDYLNLILYIEDETYDKEAKNREAERTEALKYALEEGFEIIDDNKKYTILNFIAHGSFGYTYRAEMCDLATGVKEIVAIKEYFPKDMCYCERGSDGMVLCDDIYRDGFNQYMRMFEAEPDFILGMADTKDNHVTEVKSIFEYDKTGTMYYVMKYYAGESLKDMVISKHVPTSENVIIENIVIPLCKALKAMHTHRILHLDIKPENVVIDENGEAVLIDSGVAQIYNKDGVLLSSRDTHSQSEYSAPENSSGGMSYFSPQADIFGVAATLYNLVSNGEQPFSVNNDREKSNAWNSMTCSDEMKNAIICGLRKFTNDRPSNAQLFIRNFPGCEEIKL